MQSTFRTGKIKQCWLLPILVATLHSHLWECACRVTLSLSEGPLKNNIPGMARRVRQWHLLLNCHLLLTDTSIPGSWLLCRLSSKAQRDIYFFAQAEWLQFTSLQNHYYMSEPHYWHSSALIADHLPHPTAAFGTICSDYCTEIRQAEYSIAPYSLTHFHYGLEKP